jgi:hypothetical protein
MSKLEQLCNRLESKISFLNAEKKAISSSNVAWHLEHNMLVLNGITEALKRSKPSEYKWKFNFIRLVVLTIGKIPRGRGKAPKTVIPIDLITIGSLQMHLAKTREKIMHLNMLSKDCFFEHPYFGKLKLNQAIIFLEIHTQHHLSIVDDITK